MSECRMDSFERSRVLRTLTSEDEKMDRVRWIT